MKLWVPKNTNTNLTCAKRPLKDSFYSGGVKKQPSSYTLHNSILNHLTLKYKYRKWALDISANPFEMNIHENTFLNMAIGGQIEGHF